MQMGEMSHRSVTLRLTSELLKALERRAEPLGRPGELVVKANLYNTFIGPTANL